MPIPADSPIDFARIATEMRDAATRWYNATVEVVDPNVGDVEWDAATNVYSNDPEVVVWSGKARVQPVAVASTPNIGISEGSIQRVRVQVTYDDTIGLIRKGMRVRVTDGAQNANLVGLELVVRDAINSSYGWNTTIECDVSADG